MFGRKVFISGATGFIGGRIAERLWLDCNIASRCLVRNLSRAARLARIPVVMIQGDVLNRDATEKAVRGCETVFHCAFGNTDNEDLNALITEEGTRNVGELSLENGVSRFIYLSSVAVYGPRPPENVDEETPTQFSEDAYGNSKIRAEAICEELAERGLPVTVIRPTVVFGPFSPIWTVGVIKRITAGGWENIHGMDGLCNPVFIDDLTESLFLCVKEDQAVGETFIISGERPILWKEYFDAYARTGNAPLPKTISTGRRMLLELLRRPARRTTNILRKYAEPQLVDIYSSMNRLSPRLTHKIDRMFRGGIRDEEIDKFSQKTEYSIAKAKRILGYSPRPFNEGMAITADWLRHHEYI